MIKAYLKSKKTFTPMAEIYEDELAELKLIIPVEARKTGRLNVASANEPELLKDTYRVTMNFMAIEELETEPVESQKEVIQENPDASLAFSSFAEYLSQYNLSNIAYGNVVFESSKEAPNSSTVIGYEASKNSTTSSSDDSSGQPILLIVIIILAISTFISVLMIVFDKTKATVESTNTRVYRDLILKDETGKIKKTIRICETDHVEINSNTVTEIVIGESSTFKS